MASERNIAKYVEYINFEKLVDLLNDYETFRKQFPQCSLDYEHLKSNDENKKRFTRYCLEKNKKLLMIMLLHTGQDRAAKIIEPIKIRDLLDLTRLDPSKGKLSTNCPFIGDIDFANDKLIRDEIHSVSDEYAMKRSPRGFCVLINNFFTYGTFKEMIRFRNIFYQLHFDVTLEKNLSAEEIERLLRKFSENSALETHDAFICMIISHGSDNNEIVGFDKQVLDITKVCEMFDDNNCPKLKGKPRFFVFNCCRGDEGIKIKTFDPHVKSLPKLNDFLICYSTLDGYAAWSAWNNGTKFGSSLSDFLVEKAWSRDLNKILIKTNNYLKDAQPFEWMQSFTKVLSFHPNEPHEKSFQ